MVDTGDLKSPAYGVPVRVRLRVPSLLAFVQRIGQESSKLLMGVRFPHAGPIL